MTFDRILRIISAGTDGCSGSRPEYASFYGPDLPVRCAAYGTDMGSFVKIYGIRIDVFVK